MAHIVMSPDRAAWLKGDREAKEDGSVTSLHGAIIDYGRPRADRRLRRPSGAGDRDRTDDIQLGKLTFYH